MAENSGSAAEAYRVLGLRPGALPEEVRRAYRKQAMLNHPDRNPGDAAAETRFRETLEAYHAILRSIEQTPKRAGASFNPARARSGPTPRDPARRPAYRSSNPIGKLFGRFFLIGIFTLVPVLFILFVVWANTTTDWLPGCCWGGRSWEEPQVQPEGENSELPQ